MGRVQGNRGQARGEEVGSENKRAWGRDVARSGGSRFSSRQTRRGKEAKRGRGFSDEDAGGKKLMEIPKFVLWLSSWDLRLVMGRGSRGRGGARWTDRVREVGHGLDVQQLLEDEVQLLIRALTWAAGTRGPGSK